MRLAHTIQYIGGSIVIENVEKYVAAPEEGEKVHVCSCTCDKKTSDPAVDVGEATMSNTYRGVYADPQSGG